MSNWIPFEDATYQTQQAFLMAADKTAAAMEQTFINVHTGKGGKRYLDGNGLIRNILLVDLLEDNEDVDLVLDLGGEFKYLLKTPKISGGKVFAPDTKSSLKFWPTSPWQQLSESEFEVLVEELEFLEP